MRKILLILLLISATAQAQWFPTINSQVPLLNNNNTFTGTNYFRKLIADTVTINNIARANSTYWINGTDTLGWVDAARSDVVFFPQMKIGTLQTNTTVAETFVKTSALKSDTVFSTSGSFKQLYSSSVAIADSVIDMSKSNNFTKTLSANQRFVFANTVEGQVVNVAVTNTASNYTVNWIDSDNCTIKWNYGTAPVQTIGAKTDLYSFIRIGTTIYGTAIQNF